MKAQPIILCSRFATSTCMPSRGQWPRHWAQQYRSHASSSSTSSRLTRARRPKSKVPQSACWSLLSSCPKAISSIVGSLQSKKIEILPNQTPLLVLLVTPAHLQLLDRGNIFIPSLLDKSIGLSRPGQVFDVLAAVIDRVPHTSDAKEGSISQTYSTENANESGVLPRNGYEGISVAVFDSTSAAPDLWSLREKASKPETMTISQRCTLSFSIPPSVHVFATPQKRGYQALVPRKLQLPVANTLFQNGKTSTLLAQRWTLHQFEDAESKWILNTTTSLPQQTIDMAGFFPIKEKSPDHSLHSHLAPITQGRVITAAVGNIIRRLGTGVPKAAHTDEESGGAKEEEVPASAPLETAINKGIQEGQIPPQTAGVWALIKPRNAALALRTTWWGTGPDRLQRAILSGCRLHKVLSGGGGWGEKQGLLALDPDSDYTPRQQAFESPFENLQSAEAEKNEALGEVVKPGDKVMFYVCQSPESIQPSRPSQQEGSSIDNDSPNMIFGSLPSTMDAMPSLDSVETNDDAEPSCVIVNDHFGILSEQGISLESTFYSRVISAGNPGALAGQLRRRSSPSYKKGHRTTVTTKLDAPYMLFSINGRAHASFPEREGHETEIPPDYTEQLHMNAESTGDSPLDNVSSGVAHNRASIPKPQAYRLGSSGQRSLTSDKGKPRDVRSFTTSSTYHGPKVEAMISDKVREKIAKSRIETRNERLERGTTHRSRKSANPKEKKTADAHVVKREDQRMDAKKERSKVARRIFLDLKALRKRVRSEMGLSLGAKSEIRKEIKSKLASRKALVKGSPLEISDIIHKQRTKQAAGNDGEPTVKFIAQDETPRPTLLQEAGMDPHYTPDPVQVRRHLSVGTRSALQSYQGQLYQRQLSQRGLDQQPEWNVPLTELPTAPESQEFVHDSFKEQERWMPQNHPERVQLFRRLYQDSTKSNAEMPTVPVKGSSIIRYEASDKSQRLHDTYANKLATDGFAVRKHATGYNYRKHGVGDGDGDKWIGDKWEASSQEGEFDGVEEDRRDVSARDYARKLHTEYRSGLSDRE